MKTLKTFLLLINIVVFTSCNRTKCMDPHSINYDSNSNCAYTKAIFYAPSNKVGGYGYKVTRIEVYRRIIEQEELVGVIDNLKDVNLAPEGCNVPENGIEYNFTQKDKGLFTTKYFYENGVVENGSTYEIGTSSSKECIVTELTI